MEFKVCWKCDNVLTDDEIEILSTICWECHDDNN